MSGEAARIHHVVSVAANPERWMRRARPGAQLNTWAGVLVKTARRYASREFWRARARVRRGLVLPDLDRVRGAIWAVTMVKDEIDIIEATVRHLLAQGVDQILIADNGSTDGTLELLRKLSVELPLHVGIDSETGYYQDHKMTALAQAARRHGAIWVIPFDADEFWFAPDRSLRDFLLTTDASIVTARIFNVFPTRDRPTLSGIDGRVSLDLSSPIQEKVAVRTHPALWIGMGNHSAVRQGYQRPGLRIVHVPWRSQTHLARKIRHGASAFRSAGLADKFGSHWINQESRNDDEMLQLWESVLDCTAPASLGWRPHGPFVECEPGTWACWDPTDEITEDVSRHVSWTNPQR